MRSIIPALSDKDYPAIPLTRREAQWDEQYEFLRQHPDVTVEQIEQAHIQFWGIMNFLDGRYEEDLSHATT